MKQNVKKILSNSPLLFKRGPVWCELFFLIFEMTNGFYTIYQREILLELGVIRI